MPNESMPEEIKNEEAKDPEPEVTVADVVTKATLLKKAGFPTLATVAVIALSSPGFYEFFLNQTDDEAKQKAVEGRIAAEVSYQLLKEKTETLEKQLSETHEDMKELTKFVQAALLNRAVHNPSISHSDGSASSVVLASPEELFAPPEPKEVGSTVKEGPPLPEDLDSLVQKKLLEAPEAE